MRTLAPGVKVTEGVLTQIVVQAAEAVDGVRVRRPRRRVEVAIEEGRAHVDLELAVSYGKVLPEAAREVQRAVSDALTRMCEVAVDAVDVSVEELE
ncbi:MAG: Asp23/Gls24 family envelope stress response protein [Acidobacteriota bacterium]|nr:Asp23/Gls24 family envelope stress response protein [Acidobacteriota bacterium]MDE3189580.1 Asp23/Gls24 family envelope stress response protein [Acidobacteriota bacterium]